MIKCLATKLDKKDVYVFATDDGLNTIVDSDCYNKFSLAIAAQRMNPEMKDHITTNDLITGKLVIFDFQYGRISMSVDGKMIGVSVKEALEALQEQINS